MVLRDGGPQPQWVGSHDQGADSRAQFAHPLDQLVEINTNTLTLDFFLLSSYACLLAVFIIQMR
jgi:hypothetical protein